MTQPSSMEEFEKQLKQTDKNNIISMDDELDTSKLKETEINSLDLESLNNPNNVLSDQPQVQNQFNSTQTNPENMGSNQIVKVPKNLVIAFQSDSTGCGFIRCHQPLSYLQFVFGKDQRLIPFPVMTFIYQNDILIRTRTLLFQRQMAPHHVQNVLAYKKNQQKFGYKMVWEMDDHIWWEDDERKIHGVPPYNFGSPGITEDVKLASIEIMKMMDLLVVSTPFLAYYIKEKLGIKVPIHIVPNHVARYFWKQEPKKSITEKIVKPKIIYTGSPTHYSNEKKLLGDWENGGYVEYILKNVKDGKIDLTVMGGLPWFFEEIKNKIKIFDWVNSFHYHLAILGEKADFGLMPLTKNNFNRAKSDLKAREYYAGDIYALGTYFDDEKEWQGPYHHMKNKLSYMATTKEIEEIVEFGCIPENYNATMSFQRKWMNENSGWLESSQFINNFLKVFE